MASPRALRPIGPSCATPFFSLPTSLDSTEPGQRGPKMKIIQRAFTSMVQRKCNEPKIYGGGKGARTTLNAIGGIYRDQESARRSTLPSTYLSSTTTNTKSLLELQDKPMAREEEVPGIRVNSQDARRHAAAERKCNADLPVVS